MIAETLVVRALQLAWAQVNYTVFRGALRTPAIALSDAQRLGGWHRGTRTIEIGRSLVREQPWGVVVEVLKHEMAHQYAHEILNATDETAHGPAFRWVCERLNVDPAASGLPAAATEEPKIMRRVRKLLALAESPNPNEAQAAMNAAQRLMLEHNVAVAPVSYGFRHLGKPVQRISEIDRLLAGLLGEHFFVRPIFVPAFDVETCTSGTVLEICGSPENLDMAAYVWDFLTQTADRLWQAHARTAFSRGERERQRFVAGVVRGFREKLGEGARESRETGLVWVGDAGLEAWFDRRHPRIRTTRSRGRGPTLTEEAGREAGKGIVLNRPISQGPSGGGPKLIG
ncbi:MAG: SprT-like domain-containing protein [Myxococcota bacterium]